MKFLETISSYLRASLAYLKALIRPMDSIDSNCSRGHLLLKNWSSCPHCRTLNRIEALSRRKKMAEAKAPRLSLYCLSGSNKGANFLVSNERTSIGTIANADIVLTPESLNNTGIFQIISNEKIKLSSSGGNFFKLNGQIQQSATLFDFDELEILDNRFLVMDLSSNHLPTKGDSNERS